MSETTPATESTPTPADTRREKLDTVARIAGDALRLAGLIPEAKSPPTKAKQAKVVAAMLAVAADQLAE